jgi:hypothetical protein
MAYGFAASGTRIQTCNRKDPGILHSSRPLGLTTYCLKENAGRSDIPGEGGEEKASFVFHTSLTYGSVIFFFCNCGLGRDEAGDTYRSH